MVTHIRCFGLAVFILLCASTVNAEPVSDADGRYTHDGFFLRTVLGFEYAHPSPGDGQLLQASEFILGWTLTQKLTLFYGGRMGVRTGPTEYADEYNGARDELALIDFRAGVTVYWDNNMQVTLGYGRGAYFDGTYDEVCEDECELPNDGKNASEHNAYSLSFGREWWASDNWGIGAAANVRILDFVDSERPDLGWVLGLNATFTWN